MLGIVSIRLMQLLRFCSVLLVIAATAACESAISRERTTAKAYVVAPEVRLSPVVVRASRPTLSEILDPLSGELAELNADWTYGRRPTRARL